MVARRLRAATKQLKKRRRGVAPERLHRARKKGVGARWGTEWRRKHANTGGLHDAAADFELSPS